MTTTFSPLRASAAPSAAVEVVLPTPPLPDVTTSTLPICVPLNPGLRSSSVRRLARHAPACPTTLLAYRPQSGRRRRLPVVPPATYYKKSERRDIRRDRQWLFRVTFRTRAQNHQPSLRRPKLRNPAR